MSNYNIPIKKLSVTKEQRVFQQLTNRNAFIDVLVTLYNNTTQCQHKQDTTYKFLQLYKPIYQELSTSKVSLKDFKLQHKDFVEGAFGKVTIVKSIHDPDENIYALKTLNKSYLNQQIDRSSPMEERLILSNPNEEWLPSLYASFQDKKNLYLVMEYAHGGDLENLMERKSYQFNEEEAKFYCAELILAVERVHQLGYMHRDIKPANILIDSKGHIKLGDLGSCISIDTKDSLFMVGTMPYISPEMCNFEGTVYGPEVDWWSVGIVLYELLYGVTPFTGRDIQIQMNLLNPKVSVKFNSDINVSPEAKDLLTRLLLKQKDQRLGINGAQEIKSHPFFKDIDWNTLHTASIPPFIPSIKSLDDISFFASTNNQDTNDEEDYSDDDDEEEEDLDKDLPYIGYTYSCEALSNILSKETKSPQNSNEPDQHIQSLQNQLTEKNHIINTMKQTQDLLLAEKTNTIDTLKQAHNLILTEQETTIATQKRQIEHLESRLHSLLNDQTQTNHQYQETIASLQTDKIPHLEKETQQLITETQKLTQEKTDLLQQLKSQQYTINQLKSDTNQRKLPRSNKSLPSIPTLLRQPPDFSTDRSVLSSLWQRDRDTLKQMKHALEDSESQLAFSKRQVIHLKKELKTFQKEQFILPSTPPLDAIQFFNDTIPSKNLDVMNQIKLEQDFIQSTKRTISARKKMSRRKSEMDDKLVQALDQANKKLYRLQSKLA